MKVLEIYLGSAGDATKRLYAALEAHGPIGVLAVNLFRAQKCSDRAKVYRGGVRGVGSYRSMAYGRKQWAIDNLCKGLVADSGSFLWGWKKDPSVVFDGEPSWVLYVDLPQGQVSFHSPTRGEGPDYHGEWDGMKGKSAGRVVQFCDAILGAPKVAEQEAMFA